ncbi:MAG: hypothetical protein LBV08_00135 [Clostridiales bacterium]|jgi:hypothetical protein|nr:hypothetical protein [Clostridiales bacterium]
MHNNFDKPSLENSNPTNNQYIDASTNNAIPKMGLSGINLNKYFRIIGDIV